MSDEREPHVLTAGAATVTVDVPVGTPMSGYAARLSPSTGVHDPLTVRALVVDDVGLVVVDCCALRRTTCAELRASRPVGIRDVVVAATHTHAGPCLTPHGLGAFAPDVLRDVERAFAEALTVARRGRVPVTVRYGERRAVGVGYDRRHGRPIDPPVQVLAFETPDRTVATLVTYPMHPVVLSAANTLVSSDYVGPLRDEVEAALPGSVCVFAQGCAGDVNDDRHTAEDDYSTAPTPGRDMDAAAATGRAVARAALDALATSRTLPPARATMTSADIPLDVTPLDPGEVAAEREEWARLAAGLPPERSALFQTWVAWADDWLARRPEPSSWLARVGLVSLGDVRVATLPGEPFLAVADQVRTGLGDRTLVLGYCDGVSGYLPTAEEYAHGGYEVRDAHRYYGMPGPYAPGSAERLVDAVVSLGEK